MKKFRITVMLSIVVCIAMLFGACGSGRSDEEEQSEMTRGETEQPQIMQNGEMQTDTANQARSLTEEELQGFTEYVAGMDDWSNYGFLLSLYEEPSEIDLNEVFYSGAGITQQPMSEEETEAYLKATGQEEVYTEMVRLERAEMDELLLKKTGLAYDEMKHQLDWVYLPEFDIYCAEHGDTNYQKFVCVEGSTSDEQLYTLRFRKIPMFSDEETGYYEPELKTVVVKSEDGYRFCSNRRMIEEGIIEEQTFSLTVPEFGEITFASYEPDDTLSPYADVTFLLLGENGEVLETLLGSCANNLRAAAETFCGVEAVAFPDYNKDGYTDVITICSYSYAQGPDAGNGFLEARIYAGNEYGYFVYEEDLSDVVNTFCKDFTIAGIKTFLEDFN